MSAPPHETRIQVRYGETDQMGVVHHANYLAYLEEARTRMMATAGSSYGALERAGIGLPVRKVELRYRASALYEEWLVVRTRVVGLRAASITFGYEIVREQDQERLLTATIELACVDLRTEPRKVVPLPEGLRRTMEPWLVD